MILLVESRELQRVDRPKRSCRDQHPRPSAGAASQQLIFRRTLSPWSWHHFGRVGPDGCPGFKGPFPQPVSMSGAKCRCDSALAQGTTAQPALEHTNERLLARHRRRRGYPRSDWVPKNAVNPSLGAPAATSMSRTVFGTCSGPVPPPAPKGLRRFSGRLPDPRADWRRAALSQAQMRPRVPCANALSHLHFAPLIETG